MQHADQTFTILIIPQFDCWIAQCLEYNIMAQGQTREDAWERWKKTLYSHVRVANKHGQRPFENIGEAPPEYWEMYQQKTESDPVPDLDVPPDIAEHLPPNPQVVFA